MCEALRQLGYETYHMTSLFENALDADMWRDAVEAKYFGNGMPFERKEWDQLLGAVTDFPCAAFAPELIAAYPDAKVILTLRDVDSWYTSTINSIVKGMNHPGMKVLAQIDYVFLRRWYGMVSRMMDGFFEGSFERNGKRVFKEHYEKVREVVPKENMLEYTAGQGWGPLCEFLGVEAPSTPYPRVNETASFDERIQLILKKSLWQSVKPVISGAFFVGAAFIAYRLISV
ncbi:hypothetical protein YB2330_002812 [Saitoella coloradoensis]